MCCRTGWGWFPTRTTTFLRPAESPQPSAAPFPGLKLVCPVGECHGYQNIAFDTISEVLTSGDWARTLKHLARVKAFRPARHDDGVDHLCPGFVGLYLTMPSRIPYSRRQNESRTASHSSIFQGRSRPAASASSVYDLALYLQAQMGLRPDVIPQDVLDLIHTPVVENCSVKPMGMGTSLRPDPRRGLRAWVAGL